MSHVHTSRNTQNDNAVVLVDAINDADVRLKALERLLMYQHTEHDFDPAGVAELLGLVRSALVQSVK